MEDVLKIKKFKGYLSGEITIPPDKSISHRSLIIASIVSKQTGNKIRIKNLSLGKDCVATLEILKKTGVSFEYLSERELIVDAKKAFCSPDNFLDCGNSGTSARLLSGLFSSIDGFKCTFVGDKSLEKRPMARIIKPLSLMGASITSNADKMPLNIEGRQLKAITYESPIASAQVKSAILLAGLNACGKTIVYEPYLSRNHTEIMLEYLGAKIKFGKSEAGFWTSIEKSSFLSKTIEIAGDISSAAFFMVAAAIIPNSKILIKNVGINPTRVGILKVFDQAGVNYFILNKRIISNETVADIEVCYTENIKPFKISGDIIPELIDEIPVIAVLAAVAKGKSCVEDAFDLRNKESDRISTIVESFKKFGIKIEEKEDGFIIFGGEIIEKDFFLKTHLDHRLAMSYYVLSMLNKGSTVIDGFSCVETSFPEFADLMKQIKQF